MRWVGEVHDYQVVRVPVDVLWRQERPVAEVDVGGPRDRERLLRFGVEDLAVRTDVEREPWAPPVEHVEVAARLRAVQRDRRCSGWLVGVEFSEVAGSSRV